MRILWFTNTPSNYKSGTNPYNGGGWISSLEEEVSNVEDLSLSISFILSNQPRKVEQGGTTYYPLFKENLRIKDLLHGYEYAKRQVDKHYLTQIESVINDFQPDVIHVFGSEDVFGLIAEKTEIPVILHLQGMEIPIFNSYLPPFVSWGKYYFQDFNPIKVLKRIKEKRDLKYSVTREKEILHSVNNYLGRTEFDETVTKIYNPKRTYFYCSEILRPVFYEPAKRIFPEKLRIVTTISSPLYKGFDVVLKTAQMLKKDLSMDFDWQCYGNIDPNFAESVAGIAHQDVNIKLMGVASAAELREAMLSATVYVHASYIDNSPNSLCEAQILGLPCVAAAVGGVPSLIDNGETGFLVPANDPYQLCYLIKKLYLDKELNKKIGEAAKAAAQERHSRPAIVSNLVETYNKICQK